MVVLELTKEGGKVHRLKNLTTQFVSLVTRGANRQSKFFVVKADQEDTEKAVPPADASQEDKRKAQEDRAKRYGIEALEEGAALSYPAGSPTTESLYGDPVNLKYPLGGPGNTVDLGRVRNALARFKQAAGTYAQNKSKAAVFERIVRQALQSGVNVGFDPEDPIDALLPQDLKDRLSKDDPSPDDRDHDDGGGRAEDASAADLDAWLRKAGHMADALYTDAVLDARLAKTAPQESPQVRHVDKAQQIGERRAPSTEARQENEILAKSQRENEQLRQQLDEREKKLRAAELRVRRLRKAAVGGTSALVAGLLSEDLILTDEPGINRSAWRSGGDLAK